MKRLSLLFLLLLIVFNLYADTKTVKLRIQNDAGKNVTISGTVSIVDYSGWRIQFKIDGQDIIWLKFTEIKGSIYKLLLAHSENKPENLFETARFMLFISHLDSAEKMFDKAVKAGFKDEIKINEFEAQLNEFTAQELVIEIRAGIANGKLKASIKLLNKLKSEKFAKTQAVNELTTLEQQLDRAIANSEKSDNQNTKDYEQIYSNAVKYFEDKLAEGHQIYFNQNGSSSCLPPWEEVVKNLDTSKGLITDIYRFEQKQPDGFLRNNFKTLREKALKILITTFKSLISFYLTRDAFKASYEYLRKAIRIAPLDREVLFFWYLYDEYKPPTYKLPKLGDDDDDEKDK
ncbi:MAG: hypothetical protein K8S87_03780 [Planctomycetes bacterium]|nr:hypothetical protein [Planctomycetota bacterium]